MSIRKPNFFCCNLNRNFCRIVGVFMWLELLFFSFPAPENYRNATFTNERIYRYPNRDSAMNDDVFLPF